MEEKHKFVPSGPPSDEHLAFLEFRYIICFVRERSKMSIVRAQLKAPAIAVIGLALLCFQGLLAAAPVPSKSILVIHEGAKQGPMNVLADAELEHAFAADGNQKVELFHEYLDTWRLTVDTSLVGGMIREKYWTATQRPALIMAVGTAPVRLMRDYGDVLFDRIPVVFFLNSERFVAARYTALQYDRHQHAFRYGRHTRTCLKAPPGHAACVLCRRGIANRGAIQRLVSNRRWPAADWNRSDLS